MNVSAESLSRSSRFASGRPCSTLDGDGFAGGSECEPWVTVSESVEAWKAGENLRCAQRDLLSRIENSKLNTTVGLGVGVLSGSVPDGRVAPSPYLEDEANTSYI